jgi:hypothetical protein
MARRAVSIKLFVVVIYHKGLGLESDPSSLSLIQGELPTSETVEVRSAPVRFEVGWYG